MGPVARGCLCRGLAFPSIEQRRETAEGQAQENAGRALTDIAAMGGEAELVRSEGGTAVEIELPFLKMHSQSADAGEETA